MSEISFPRKSILVLENGSFFSGVSIGAQGQTVGELIFNTALTGYQETLSDPSYAGQIIIFTNPHIGNVGTNIQDQESLCSWPNGIIVKSLSMTYSNWRAEKSLEAYLQEHNIVGISNIDTRALVRIVRSSGSLRACIMSDEIDHEKALMAAKTARKIEDINFVERVSTDNVFSIKKSNIANSYHIVIYDFGIKKSILEALDNLGCDLTIVPWNTSYDVVYSLNPDGILLSNGPGDPSLCKEALKATRQFLRDGCPIFGLCLGHQILALACDGYIYKMKFGHHGSNHPILDLETEEVFITTQNHSFCVEKESLPSSLAITHLSLFDKTIQGIRHKTKPAFGLQGHPEASPGPHDLYSIFHDFFQLIKSTKKYKSMKKEYA